ncbi:MAG TPA: ABC transporter substrate-binding protein [Propionibacteriaceae bacterium]
MTLTRRRLLAATGTLAAASLLSACNSSSTTPVEVAANASPSGTGFPVAVTHKYGVTEVLTPPQRIVTVGLTEQDTLLALGHRPVGVTEWYGKQPSAVWPWARTALGDAQPEVLSTADGFQLEKIGALVPDLIIGTNSGMTKQDYASLSKLAPTIANSGNYDSDYFEPWTIQTSQIGAAVGRPAEAAQLIADIQRRYRDAAAAHPQFANQKAVFLQAPYYEGNAIAYQDGLGTDFITDLGFTVPKEIDAYATEDGQAYLPVEKLDVLDVADVLIWATENDAARAELEKNKLFGQLRAVREGCSLYTGAELSGAIYFSTVLSLPYILDTLLPQLERVLPA